jgi:hypothetical protein
MPVLDGVQNVVRARAGTEDGAGEGMHEQRRLATEAHPDGGLRLGPKRDRARPLAAPSILSRGDQLHQAHAGCSSGRRRHAPEVPLGEVDDLGLEGQQHPRHRHHENDRARRDAGEEVEPEHEPANEHGG